MYIYRLLMCHLKRLMYRKFQTKTEVTLDIVHCHSSHIFGITHLGMVQVIGLKSKRIITSV